MRFAEDDVKDFWASLIATLYNKTNNKQLVNISSVPGSEILKDKDFSYEINHSVMEGVDRIPNFYFAITLDFYEEKGVLGKLFFGNERIFRIILLSGEVHYTPYFRKNGDIQLMFSINDKDFYLLNFKDLKVTLQEELDKALALYYV